MAPKCPHCGSNQVSEFGRTENSSGGTGSCSVRYFCRNCKKDFTITETRQHAPGMTWLVTIEPGGPLNEFKKLEFFRNSNGAIYLWHKEKMGKVYRLVVSSGCSIQYRWSGSNREEIQYTSSAILKMNSELTRQACEKKVFSDIYSQETDSFSLRSYRPSDEERGEIALFLNGVLCTQETPSEGCYVATCVYGSYDCPQVWTLRRFRDDTLGKNAFGRAFIRLYYAVSPAVVRWFGNTGWFRRLWRDVLDRLVRRLNAEGVKNTPYMDRNWRKQ